MKKIKYSRRLIAAAAIIASLGIGAIGIGTTFAAQAEPEDGMASLVEAIAEKFDLSVSDVQAVFDEQREQKQAEREAKEAERLAQEVTDGKITQDQADAITAKREEMRDFMESLSTLDNEARREAMKTQREELKQWADDNDIPMFYFRGGPHDGRPGPRPGRGFGDFQPIDEELEEIN